MADGRGRGSRERARAAAALLSLAGAWLFVAAGCRAGVPVTGTQTPAATAVRSRAASTQPPGQPVPTATPAATEPAFGSAPIGPTENALLVRVVDGDTIVVELGGRQQRVRYIGIDTPESAAPGSPVEPFARAAARANAELLGSGRLVLERDVSETDRFGRLLRYVWVTTEGGWLMVNHALVLAGFANAATYPPDVRYAELFRLAERTARREGRGLWGSATEPP